MRREGETEGEKHLYDKNINPSVASPTLPDRGPNPQSRHVP